MSVPGNKRTLYVGIQDDIDTPQPTPTRAFHVTNFVPNPVRAEITLAETDATTQQPADVVVGNTPGFTFDSYLRSTQAALLLLAVLGVSVDTGSTPHYVHTITPTTDTPYLTFFEDEPGVWCNEYDGVRVTQVVIAGQTGGAATISVTCEAISFTAGVDSPGSPAPDVDLPLVYPEVTVKRGGVHPGTASQFSITIARNGQRAQGDNGFNSLDYDNGLFEITGQITKYASDDTDQRQVDTGSKTGTTPTTAIFSETLEIKLTRDANTSIDLSIGAVSWPTRSAPVDTSGAPLAEVMGFRSLPQATLAANIVAVVKDANATPA